MRKFTLLVFAFLMAELTACAAAQELYKLLPADGAQADHFGNSIAISGNTVVVGAYRDDNNSEIDSGSVYVFENGIEVAKLTASDTAAGDLFGTKVAIDGDTIVVGAPNGSPSGSAYVFLRPASGWTSVSQENAKLLPSDAHAYKSFGCSVAVSGDTVVVGAKGDSDGSGAAYVFVKPSRGWPKNLPETTKLTASDANDSDYFGSDVAISSGTVIVGAQGNDDNGSFSGSAYIFESPRGWEYASHEIAKLTASDANISDYFGLRVAIDHDTAVIGAYHKDNKGAAYIFVKPAAGWADTSLENAKLTASGSDYFGYDVAISADTVIIADPMNDGPGQAFLFIAPPGGWADTSQANAVLIASDGVNYDSFAYSVGIDGDTVVIGSYNDDDNGADSGSAYVFKLNDTAFLPSITSYLLN